MGTPSNSPFIWVKSWGGLLKSPVHRYVQVICVLTLDISCMVLRLVASSSGGRYNVPTNMFDELPLFPEVLITTAVHIFVALQMSL